jgi:hypothetical protein
MIEPKHKGHLRNISPSIVSALLRFAAFRRQDKPARRPIDKTTTIIRSRTWSWEAATDKPNEKAATNKPNEERAEPPIPIIQSAVAHLLKGVIGAPPP